MMDPNEMPQFLLALLLSGAALCALVVGFILVCKNGWVAIQKMRGKTTGHIVPVVGGVILFLGVYISPIQDARSWAFLALILDVGSVPYLLYSVVILIRKKTRYQ